MQKLCLAVVFFFLASLAQAEPLPVVASFSILGDMVKQMGGDAVSVRTLVGSDADTHTYQPTPEDSKALASAQVIFVNGLSFEGWIDRLIPASGTKAKVIVASQGVTPRRMVDEDKGGKTVADPHAWQNAVNGRIYVKNIAAALEAALPSSAAEIRARAAKYDSEIVQADAWVKKEIGVVPKARRKIITSHDAFGYFGAAYGVTFLAPEGVSTEAEPSAAQMARLVEQVKKEKVKFLFFENMANKKLIEQIARETGAQMGGTLYSDALSAEAPTYLEMFRNNVPKLVEAMMRNRK
ncbi:MAG: metal ABC transporter substrate-binding protein [Proteobacteria bacterium]|nr:metal ABC transporter substrate-binding protein [Pseudomonadota bacterium]